MSSIIESITQNTKLFENYGVVITCQGCNGMDGTLIGIQKEALSFSGSMTPGESALAGGASGILNGMISAIPGVGEMAKDAADLQTMGTTVKTYSTGSGYDELNINMIYIPNYLGNGSFKDAQSFITKMTLPKTPTGPDLITPYEGYYYSKTGFFENFASGSYDGQFLNVNIGKQYSGGGFYCMSSSTSYSYEVDENGSPLYMNISLTLNHYRGLFADEALERLIG
jgi:hypothetical protein